MGRFVVTPARRRDVANTFIPTCKASSLRKATLTDESPVCDANRVCCDATMYTEIQILRIDKAYCLYKFARLL